MAKCATRHPADWREGRRLRGWELKQEGWTPQRIADALGVTAVQGDAARPGMLAARAAATVAADALSMGGRSAARR